MILVSVECFKLVKSLLKYAAEKRDEGVYDFTGVLDGFYKDVLKVYEKENESARNNFVKRMIKMCREFVETDPRYQSRMDQFGKEVR